MCTHPQERMNYEESLKDYRDMYSVMKTQLDKGRAQGKAEGLAEGLAEGMAEGMAKGKAEGLAQGKAEGKAEANVENARKMKAKGYAIADISEITGLSIEFIENL